MYLLRKFFDSFLYSLLVPALSHGMAGDKRVYLHHRWDRKGTVASFSTHLVLSLTKGNLACQLSKTGNSISTLHSRLKSYTATNSREGCDRRGFTQHCLLRSAQDRNPGMGNVLAQLTEVCPCAGCELRWKVLGKTVSGAAQLQQGVFCGYKVECPWWGTNICYACGGICPREPLQRGKKNGQALMILQ